MKVLVACEFSGKVRNAFLAKGHDAISCDLKATIRPGPHYKGDVFDILYEDWDMIIAFPPCTHLSNAGNRFWKEKQRDGRQANAVEFFKKFWYLPNVEKICIENPIGYMNSNWRKPTQIVQPYMFGDPWVKSTCLWLAGLPPLKPKGAVMPAGYFVTGGSVTRKEQREKIGFKHGPANSELRSITFDGIAKAMAEQWG